MAKPLRALIIEDSPDDAELLARELTRGGYDVACRRAENAAEMKRALDECAWDVVISDYVLPAFSAPAALAVLKSSGLDVPFIIVSGAIGEETAVAAMKAGAHDFITKGSLARLVPAVERELGDAEVRRANRLAEEALKRSEERYRALVELSPDAVIVCVRGTIVFANGAAARILGAQRGEELVGKRVLDIVAPESLDAWGPRLRRVAEEKCELPPGEIALRNASGSTVEVELMSAALEFQGRAGAQVVFRDITERKRAGAAIRDYQRQLRLLASEVALSEERERRRIAQELHDGLIQTLAISSMKLSEAAALAKSKELARTLGEIRGAIQESIRSARTLTFDLASPVLHELGLEAALERLSEELNARYGLPVRFEDDSREKPLGQNVRTVLYQGARELAVNALKHAAPKTLKISVRRNDGEVNVSVEDDGKGFDVPEVWRNIHRGSGLGLFGVRERLRHFGGHLEMRSEAGKGTRATMVAPLDDSCAKSGESPKG